MPTYTAEEADQIINTRFEAAMARKRLEDEAKQPAKREPYTGNDPLLLISEGLRTAKVGTQANPITPEMISALSNKGPVELISEGLRGK